MNQVAIVGNLGEDVDLRYTPGGDAVCNLRVAVNRRYQDQSGEWKDATTWVTVQCWRDLAENVAESLSKGDRVVVVGRLNVRTWETKEGEKRSSTEVSAEDVGVGLRFATVKTIERRKSGS